MPAEGSESQAASAVMSSTLAPSLSSAAGARRTRLSRSAFSTELTQHLLSLGTGEVLLGLTSSMPLLSTYMKHWTEATSGDGGSCVPATHAEALVHRTSFHDLVMATSFYAVF